MSDTYTVAPHTASVIWLYTPSVMVTLLMLWQPAWVASARTVVESAS